MQVMTRRGLLAGGAILAGGTLAAALALRKPPISASPPFNGGAFVAHPIVPAQEAGGVALQTLDALQPANPPHAPAEASFADAEGGLHRLAEFAGRGLVLNLWATWCVPCVAELPALAALAAQVASEGIVVLPLSSDRGGADVVRRFYAAHRLEALPIWVDPKGDAMRAWGARGIPTTLVIDRAGLERGRLEGAADWGSVASVAAIRKLVG